MVTDAAAQARLKTLNRVVSERSRQIEALPEQERSIAKLTDRANILEHTSQLLSEKYYTLQVDEKSTIPSAHIASSAYPVPVPAAPRKLRNTALFLALGILLSIAAAAIAERLDNRIHDERVVNDLLGETALAVIPDERSLNRPNGRSSDLGKNSPLMEAFRILRNVILFSVHDQDIKLLAITSPGRGEGKSTTAVNLAKAIATVGKRILIIDCDLRRPSLHHYLHLSQEPGLTDVVKGQVTLEKAVVPTDVKNVFCLPSGQLPDDPAAFLNSAETNESCAHCPLPTTW